MTGFELFLYATLQGFSEFLPISSSGHLALFHHFKQIPAALGIQYTVAAHLGTLVAVCYFFRNELYTLSYPLLTLFAHPFCTGKTLTNTAETRHNTRLLAATAFYWLLLLGLSTIPAALAGWLLKAQVVVSFASLNFIAWGFLLSASCLLLLGWRLVLRTPQLPALSGNTGSADNAAEAGRYVFTRARPPTMMIVAVLLMGLAQAFAIFPGVSRVGVTITAGIYAGLPAQLAVRISFLLSIPLIIGAAIWELLPIVQTGTAVSAAVVYKLMFIMVSAAVVGWVVLKWIFVMLDHQKLHYWAYYLIILAGGVFYYMRFIT